MEAKLGLSKLASDHDLAKLVEQRLPTASLDALTASGITGEEVNTLIIPRRTLVHRKARSEKLTSDESDRAVRLARITSMAEEIFGANDRAARWLRKPKTRFEGQTPMQMLQTESGARLVEQMLLQLEHGMVA
jgi:putative toxin-antitoxin system antitoxin component (TIGR02293 family)